MKKIQILLRVSCALFTLCSILLSACDNPAVSEDPQEPGVDIPQGPDVDTPQGPDVDTPEWPQWPADMDEIPFIHEDWTDETFTSLTAAPQWYIFEAEADKYYSVEANEAGGAAYGDGTKTGNVSIFLHRADRTSLMSKNGTKYDVPGVIFTDYTGTVIVKVVPNATPGTYAVRYREFDPSDYPPVFVPLRLLTGNPAWGTSHYPVLNWRPVPGAANYKVYRSTSIMGTYSYIGETTAGETRYKDTSAEAGTSYYCYKVSGFNEHGEGRQSNFASVSNVAVPGGGAPNSISLTNNTWHSNEFKVFQPNVDWYVFNASPEITYQIQVNEKHHGDGTQTGYPEIDVYDSSGSPLIVHVYYGAYDIPLTVTGQTGPVYIRLTPEGGLQPNIGTYQVRFYAAE